MQYFQVWPEPTQVENLTMPHSMGGLLPLLTNIVLQSDKHCALNCPTIRDEAKMIQNIDARCQSNRIFFPSSIRL